MPGNGFICAVCGEWHEGLPLDYAFRLPDHFFTVPETERPARTRFTPSENPDFCKIDEHCFVRGVVRIPLLGTDDYFCWGAWTTLSAVNFERVREHWLDEEPPHFEPLFGWFANHIPVYPETLSLKAQVIMQKTTRPFIQLEPTDHPLSIDQQVGITTQRVQEMLHELGAI